MKRLLLLLVLLLAAVDAAAAPTVSCHCFQDRSFDPLRPAAVDPYILATTQNTLLAAAFGLDKKDVVRAKMTGVSGDELWLVHYLSDRSGLVPEKIAAARRQADNWRAAVHILGIDPASLSPAFFSALLGQADEALLAAAAADATLVDFCAVAPEEVGALRKAGASTAETVLASLLARKTGRAGAELFASVRDGSATWGGLLQGAAVEPTAIGSLFVQPAD